ncbi:MAG: hypothetical protein OXG46_02150 [Chloroflexi bacterium]|nr:hypothetical protein [Chloroflexota bacterium]MCY3937838.1 hypothetical protein [Chloroflexota bacterium]
MLTNVWSNRVLAIALALLIASHVGFSAYMSVKYRIGPAGPAGFPPSPLARTVEQRRQHFMHDPYVFIQAIRSYTSDDSMVVVPDNYEGGYAAFVGRYYLFPRQIVRLSPGDPIPAEATHVVSSEGVNIDGASRIAVVSGNFALYRLPTR